MTQKIIYFINPVSGTKGKEALLKMISTETHEQGIPFEICHTNAAGDYGYLPEKILAEQVTDVVICGGDGTVNQVAAALVATNVRVGIIPMGSGNGLALAARIPRNSYSALQLVFKANARRVDAFTINGRFSCMLCGLGFDAQVAHDFAKQRKRGLATYIKQTFRNFFRFSPCPFTITVDGKTMALEAWFISIANSNQFGNNVTIAPRASLSDGLLDIVVVKKMNRLTWLWKTAWQIRSGKISAWDEQGFAQKSILYFHTSAITIENPRMAPLHIDGEPVETTSRFEITILPGAINLLQP